MPRRDQEVSLRLSVKEREVIRKALQNIGEDGERMAKILDRQTKKANRALQALDQTTSKARDGMEDLADSAGPLGGILKSLGPAGIAAGAAIGGLVLGLGAAVRVGTEAVNTFAEIGKQADVLGITVETFQALRAESDAQGISFSVLETGMRALEERQSQIVQGQGELFTRLKDTNPELLKQLEALDNNEDRLRAVSQALADAETQTDRNRIAYAAFGEAGVQVSKVLLSTGGSIDELVAKGRDLGLVLDEELIRRSQALQVEMDVTSQVIDLQLKQAFIDLAPLGNEAAKMFARVAREVANVAEAMREVEDRSSRFNLERISNIQSRLIEGGFSQSAFIGAGIGGNQISESDLPNRFNHVSRREMRRLIREFNEIAATETQRAASAFIQETRRELAGLSAEQLGTELERTRQEIAAVEDGAVLFQGEPLLGTDNDERQRRADIIESLIEEAKAREAGAAATREMLEAEQRLKDEQTQADKDRRERLTLVRQAATLLQELGDATLALQLKESELTKLREKGHITQEQFDQALQSYRDKLTGVTAATERWTKVVDGADTEVETLQKTIAELNDDLASGALGEGTEATKLYTDALKALSDALGLAKQAEAEATDEFKAAAEIRKKLATARQAAASEQDLVAAEQKRLDALVAAGNLTRDEATEFLKLYTRQLREARGQVSLLERAETVLDGVMTGRIKTVGDLKRAIGALVVDMIRQAAIAQAQIGNGQGFGGFLQGLVGNVLGGFGGSGNGGLNPSGTPPIVPQSHSGSRAPNFPTLRSMRQPMMSNEKMVVVEDGQEIINDNHRAQIIDYVRAASNLRNQPNAHMRAGPIPLAINLNIRQEGGDRDAEVSASQSGDNQLDIDVFMRDGVRGVASSGGLDDLLERRGFVRQSVG